MVRNGVLVAGILAMSLGSSLAAVPPKKAPPPKPSDFTSEAPAADATAKYVPMFNVDPKGTASINWAEVERQAAKPADGDPAMWYIAKVILEARAEGRGQAK